MPEQSGSSEVRELREQVIALVGAMWQQTKAFRQQVKASQLQAKTFRQQGEQIIKLQEMVLQQAATTAAAVAMAAAAATTQASKEPPASLMQVSNVAEGVNVAVVPLAARPKQSGTPPITPQADLGTSAPDRAAMKAERE